MIARVFYGGVLRLIAANEDKVSIIADAMVQDEHEDAKKTLASLPPAERKLWRARARAALRGLDKVVGMGEG